MAHQVIAGPNPTRRLGRRLAAALVVLVLAGCESDQDPGLDTSGGQGTDRTSDTLGACPPDGPDETTPDAGCLDPDGSVQRP
jgi:uncharacterized lipoprotein